MRVLAAALLAVLGIPTNAAQGDLAVTVASRHIAQSCAVQSIATITSFDAGSPREIMYRFLHSDGSATPTGRMALSGSGVVAQSVRDRWTPHSRTGWVALEIVEPRHLLSQRSSVVQHCSRADLAKAG